MSQFCRFCLEFIENNSSNLTDYHDGFQISVIAMIILPIRINPDEKNLSQKVCSKCLEILLNTFRLREICLESDRKLKEIKINNIQDDVEVKEEQTENDSNYYYEENENQQIISSPTNNENFVTAFDVRELQELDEIYSDDLRIECNKKVRVKNASKVWNFFGDLYNGLNELVGSPDFRYCSPCLQNKKITKYRTTTATSSLANHLEIVHGITKYGEIVEPQRGEEFKQPKKRKVEGGSATVCSECGKVFSCSTIMKRHMRTHGEKSFACSW